MLDTEEVIRSFEPSGSARAAPAVGLAFRCESAADVDRVFGELTSAGHAAHKEPW
jgi:hypothetical protein